MINDCSSCGRREKIHNTAGECLNCHQSRKKQNQEQKEFNDLVNSLRSSQDLSALEKNYQVIKGGGIAFIDGKKVYVKGSEIGFSLQTLERILAQQSQRSALHQSQIASIKQSSNQTLKNTLINGEWMQAHLMTSDNLSNSINNTLEELIKPKEVTDNTPYQMQQKKKKKQKRIKF